MKHKQFEKLLLNFEPLDQTEDDLLKTHLSSCQRCNDLRNAWNSIEQNIKSDPMVNAPPEFISNWEIYLVLAKEKRAKRTSIALAGSLLVVSSTGSLIFYLTSLSNFSISEILSLIFTRLGYFIAQLLHAIRGFSSLSKAFPIFLPISTGIGLSIFFMTIMLLGFWVVSMFRIILPKQGVV
ncbi:MAG: hypothetical protein MUO40_10255 [Anaerolineaceae bacterium]|nr:hypothetical protein [Anaerolineaceae bacterium]